MYILNSAICLLVFTFGNIQANTYSDNTETILEQTEITGTVSDANGDPLPGVNILVVGTSSGTQTDFDGNFAISAAADAILEFSFIGFATQQVAVDGRTTINVVLQEDATTLDEVVVVGYGSQTKKEVTSSVVQLGEEEFNKASRDYLKLVKNAKNIFQKYWQF